MTETGLYQHPEPGRRLLQTRGDSIAFTLTLPKQQPGQAWLRTNLGQSRTIRREIMRSVSHDESLLGRDWFDIRMEPAGGSRFRIVLGLCEIGHFEAKCFFLPEGESVPVWPPGDNVTINIAPTDTCCANILYNAFVRQFGPNKDGSFAPAQEKKAAIEDLDRDGYTVIPPSGTFRDLIAELDFIIGYLGCRFIQLLPVNPTPTTYGRMGRFGSPYASLDFTSIDPALAEFDPGATPLEQFIELVDAVHARAAKLILDIAPNHTGWAAELHETHPEWLARDATGNIEAPGAWGVTWADLARLDYRHKDLWQYMGEVFLVWCRRGVDGFRCDAGYMIPLAAWLYIISAVRSEFPETIFFLEGLGGKLSVTRRLLNKGGFDWAYSELFQNYDRARIEGYLPEPLEASARDGIMINFAETHDNNRLAATSTRYAAMRTALCALCAPRGGFGFANGVEWFAGEKIDVHEAKSLNWGSRVNQTKQIRRISCLLKTHPAFFDQAEIRMIQNGGGEALVFLRRHEKSGKRLLIAASLDWQNPQQARWYPGDAGIEALRYTDLLSDQGIEAGQAEDGAFFIDLAPGRVLCLSAEEPGGPWDENPLLPERIGRQRLRAAALEVFQAFFGTRHLGDFDPESAAAALAEDPEGFCRQLNPDSGEPRTIRWQWPADCRRQVMVPPGHILLIRAPAPFRARLVEKSGKQGRSREKTCQVTDSMEQAGGENFALLFPPAGANAPMQRFLRLSVYETNTCTHAEAPLLYLGGPEHAAVRRLFGRRVLKSNTLKFLGTNGRGAMMRAHGAWARINSKYDGLLAANLNPDYPDERRMLLIRCRAWLVFQGFSQEISLDCQQQFRVEDRHTGVWHFSVPCGQGQHVDLDFCARMIEGENRVTITASRLPAQNAPDLLPDARPVQLIIRPDIDHRSFHANTKAYLGPEHEWPQKCSLREQGFEFAPAEACRLQVSSSSGRFVSEPEWQYMQYLPVEEERGMDPHTDLFSPGYFALTLAGSGAAELRAQADGKGRPAASAGTSREPGDDTGGAGFEDGLQEALSAYIVPRRRLHTVIAGYPWFLDWGRDTLIVTRGLIAADRFSEAETILLQFAEMESGGTLPNMIRGEDAQNRDTSDAPLWFFVACAELVRAWNNTAFLEKSAGGRSIRQVLASIAEGYIGGTPNGIRMDPESGLIYSPAHFTWMDTNHPAGSPRQGYPIEIQALWHFALGFMARCDEQQKQKWQELAGRVQNSVAELFVLPDREWLSDCLHADAATPASAAAADDALRPNQLFALTLGAVTDRAIQRRVLASCTELLVPGAIRSLADRPVAHPLPILRDGRLLNDPHHPYQGVYTGDEDTSRKPAYHNGTAWTWVFPSFCEAWVLAYGDSAKYTALSWLAGSSLLINTGCAGQVPEIVDGDWPHTQRGCDAQAWGVSELLRVWLQLTE